MAIDGLRLDRGGPGVEIGQRAEPLPPAGPVRHSQENHRSASGAHSARTPPPHGLVFCHVPDQCLFLTVAHVYSDPALRRPGLTTWVSVCRSGGASGADAAPHTTAFLPSRRDGGETGMRHLQRRYRRCGMSLSAIEPIAHHTEPMLFRAAGPEDHRRPGLRDSAGAARVAARKQPVENPADFPTEQNDGR